MKILYTKINIGCVIAVLGLLSCSSPRDEHTVESRVEQLPYYNEATFTPKWFVDDNEVPVDFHRIPSFELRNQEGEMVNDKTTEGKIYVADFFFTTCPGICPKMTKNMKLVQDAFLESEDVLLLSHSVMPETDSVETLKSYAKAMGVVSSKWHLLTGERAVIYDLGRRQYFVEEDLGLEKDLDDFIHTENFVLVDVNNRIRGIYNGLNKTAVNQLIADIKTLQKSK
tara:strand:- start:6470 stop:7147 length:678 start_codon:yes stop_codon:yes gene_type:complete